MKMDSNTALDPNNNCARLHRKNPATRYEQAFAESGEEELSFNRKGPFREPG